MVEDMEMAVDEEEEEVVVKDMAEISSPLYRTSLSWEERTISSSLKASEAEEVTFGLLQGLDFCGRFSSFFNISFSDAE